MMQSRVQILLAALAALVLFTGCGPKAYVRGEYDDVGRTNLLNDKWSETDMQVVAESLVKSMLAHPALRDAPRPPVVMVTNLQNKTSEHIDTQSIMDMIRVELMKSGKVGFIDKEARGDIADEYAYQEGNVGEETRKEKGGQIGADFIVNGRLDSIVQAVGKDKTVYYKVTLNLTNLKTSMMVWSDQKQIRKAYKKRTVGL